MKDVTNENYAVVDEEFLNIFNEDQRAFMKKVYYDYYCSFFARRNKRMLSEDDFFKNMHRRRIQLRQLCCPYCGRIEIFIFDKKLQANEGFNYCVNCGRGSALNRIIEQISRFKRIERIHQYGLAKHKKTRPNSEDWLIAYDVYQVEIITMASIIEVIFKDYFEALIYITNFGISNDYLNRTITYYTRNDFMRIDKANDHFKKAFQISLKDHISSDDWNNLIDIVNLRNMIVHNNGFVDKHFTSTPTYERKKDRVDVKLYRLEKKDIEEYFSSLIKVVVTVSNIYLERYYSCRNAVIVNHYFNKQGTSH